MAIRSKHEREQIEKRLLLELKNIYRLYKEYNPNGGYLTLAVVPEGKNDPTPLYTVNNSYYKDDKEIPVYGVINKGEFISYVMEDDDNGKDAD